MSRALTIPTFHTNGPSRAWLIALVVALVATAALALPGLAPSPSFARVAALAGATLISEDLTCITAGQLIAAGMLDPVVGMFGCFAGIYVGDLSLWFAGRVLGRRVVDWPWLARKLPREKLERFGNWFDSNTGKSVIAARFLPGTRLPLYFAAGTLGRRGGTFAFWTFVAALAWTPTVILLVAGLGNAFVAPFQRAFGNSGAMLIGILALFLLLRIATLTVSRSGRLRLAAKVSKIWQWEFWPGWLFYLPLIPWIAYLSLRRGGLRGFSSITAANPGIPHGGFVGESKHQILSALHSPHVSPTVLIPSGPVDERIARFEDALRVRGWSFPLILKPDVGQRGAGVKLACSTNDAVDYLSRHRDAILAQPFHAGPFEAGVFYCRLPDEPIGRIFSITDKHFPEVVGDGARTLEQLVWDHPRYRMQAATFIARHAGHANHVLPTRERFRLALAGNHCQGTLFRDGSHLVTPELERTIDAIARTFPGFYFGRFDVRYASVDALRAGRDFSIIELNGVTSESTNIYDPSRSLAWAYRTLFRQWLLLFHIADQSIASGNRPTSPLVLLKAIIAYYRLRESPVVSD